MTIDTRFTLETAEGTDLPLYPAGFWIRSLAYLIDFAIRTAAVTALGIVFSRSGLGMAAFLIGFFVLEWFYPVYFEVWRDGQTIGKKLMKLRVIHDDGTPMTFAASLTRNLLRTADFMPLFYVAGVIATVCNQQFKRLGDLAAGTLVVYANPKKEAPQIRDVGALPVPEGFNTDEQRQLLAFAQRCTSLTPDRQAELAQILNPVINSAAQSNDNVKTIEQMANYIVGKR